MGNKLEYNRSIRAMADIHDGHRGHHSDETWRRVKNDYKTIQIALDLMKKYKISNDVTVFDGDLVEINAIDLESSYPEMYRRLEKEYKEESRNRDDEYSGLFGKTRVSDFNSGR